MPCFHARSACRSGAGFIPVLLAKVFLLYYFRCKDARGEFHGWKSQIDREGRPKETISIVI